MILSDTNLKCYMVEGRALIGLVAIDPPYLTTVLWLRFIFWVEILIGAFCVNYVVQQILFCIHKK